MFNNFLFRVRNVDFDDYKTMFNWLTEFSGKEKWRKIQWRHDLWDARVESAKSGKPIFIWAMNGDPLGCVWNNGVSGRASVFSDDYVIETLNDKFIPVVDNVSKSQVRKDEHGEFFRKIAEQGHYAGRTVPTNTRQGLYDAVRIWNKTTTAERSPKIAKSFQADPKFSLNPPTDGLILRMITRDLPREARAKRTDLTAFNLDHVWISKEEMLSMVPDNPSKGQLVPIPKVIAERIARFHLLDSVRGESRPFDEDQVKIDNIGLKVMKVSDETIKFVIYGRSKTSRPPSKKVNPYTNARITKEMGTDLVWSGAVIFDRQEERFTRFDLLAAGKRWGRSLYNFRDNDTGPAPIGFGFQIVEDDPTAPRFQAYYR